MVPTPCRNPSLLSANSLQITKELSSAEHFDLEGYFWLCPLFLYHGRGLMLSPWPASPGLSCPQSFFCPSLTRELPSPLTSSSLNLGNCLLIGHTACCSTICLLGPEIALQSQARQAGTEKGNQNQGYSCLAFLWIPGQTDSNKKGVASSSPPHPGRPRPQIWASSQHKGRTDAIILRVPRRPGP